MQLQHKIYTTRKIITFGSYFKIILKDIHKMTLDLYITTIYEDFVNFLKNKKFG